MIKMQGDRCRITCLIIGYLHLISSLVDIGYHLLLVCIATNGFQCDAVETRLYAVDWPWLKEILLVVNLGTHGFYPFPIILSNLNSAYVNSNIPLIQKPRCYPGMFHVYVVDVLNFLINLIWLRLVISFLIAVHKRDQGQIKMFYGLLIIKLMLQVVYFIFQPDVLAAASTSFWFLEFFDVCLASAILLIIHGYIQLLNAERRANDQLPSYVECLITNAPYPAKDDAIKTEKAGSVEYKKKEDTPAILPI